MSKKAVLAVLCLALACLGGAEIPSAGEKSHAKKTVQMKEKMLSYIAGHEGEEFDYMSVAKQLNISYKELFQYLSELEKRHRIVVVQHYLRKPILITEDDYINYFWKIYIPSDEHSHSELGSLPEPGLKECAMDKH
jgi:hypothetical protein